MSSPGNSERRKFTTAQKDWYCKKFDEGQQSWPITPAEYAKEMGLSVQVFYRWLRVRGVVVIYTRGKLSMNTNAANDDDGRLRYWRHGGITTKRGA